jgi:hypothetical protein
MWTQLLLDRAGQFLAVSDHQVLYLQKMLDKAHPPPPIDWTPRLIYSKFISTVVSQIG